MRRLGSPEPRRQNAGADGAAAYRSGARAGDDARRGGRDAGNQFRDIVAKAPEIRTGLGFRRLERKRAPARSAMERASIRIVIEQAMCAAETANSISARMSRWSESTRTFT